jgi:hypothetical protein
LIKDEQTVIIPDETIQKQNTKKLKK